MSACAAFIHRLPSLARGDSISWVPPFTIVSAAVRTFAHSSSDCGRSSSMPAVVTTVDTARQTTPAFGLRTDCMSSLVPMTGVNGAGTSAVRQPVARTTHIAASHPPVPMAFIFKGSKV